MGVKPVVRNIFSKNALALAGITFFLLAAAYFIGLNVNVGNGFLALPRQVDGMIMALFASPFVVGLNIVYISVRLKSKHVLIGYLLLTVVASGVACGAAFAINKLSSNAHDRKTAENTRLQNDYVNDTIAPIILKEYPNAQF